jgi:hypothetical protein
MKKVLFSLAVFLFGASMLYGQTTLSNEWTTYGKKLTATKMDSLAAALKEIPAEGKSVAVEGVISDVCTNKGCWLIMSAGGRQLRVQFEGYSFFVPWDAKGKKIKAQGVIKTKKVDEKTARHWAEEQSQPAVKPEDIHGEQTVFMMTAAGVAIERGGPIGKEQQDVIEGKKKKAEHDEKQ